MYALDDLDRQIIELWRAEPRIGVLETSRRLEVARGTVQARIDKMLEAGVIAGFISAIDSNSRISTPLHPGARRYYDREKPGLLQQSHRLALDTRDRLAVDGDWLYAEPHQNGKGLGIFRTFIGRVMAPSEPPTSAVD